MEKFHKFIRIMAMVLALILGVVGIVPTATVSANGPERLCVTGSTPVYEALPRTTVGALKPSQFKVVVITADDEAWSRGFLRISDKLAIPAGVVGKKVTLPFGLLANLDIRYLALETWVYDLSEVKNLPKIQGTMDAGSVQVVTSALGWVGISSYGTKWVPATLTKASTTCDGDRPWAPEGFMEIRGVGVFVPYPASHKHLTTPVTAPANWPMWPNNRIFFHAGNGAIELWNGQGSEGGKIIGVLPTGCYTIYRRDESGTQWPRLGVYLGQVHWDTKLGLVKGDPH